MTKYKRNPNTVASKLQDELVMIDVDLGKYFALNPVATDIWEIIKHPSTKEEIVQQLLDRYNVDEKTCISQVDNFIKKLLELKLVTTEGN